MSTGPLQVGVIGVGYGAEVTIPGFLSEGWEVRSVFSRSQERGLEAAKSCGVPEANVYTNALELIEDDQLDAVAITTPSFTHYELATVALENGKHVLCEKPFTTNGSQALELRDLASQAGLTAMIGHEFRYSPQRWFIRDLLGRGAIGDFQLCTIDSYFGFSAGYGAADWEIRGAVPKTPPIKTWKHEIELGGGLLGALGSHYIDGLLDWFGEVKSVSGTVDTLRPDVIEPESGATVQADGDDAFTFRLNFREGGTAAMQFVHLQVPGRPSASVAIMGTEGTIYVDQAGPNPGPDEIKLDRRDGLGLQPIETPSTYEPFSDERDPRLVPFRLLVRDFEKGIANGVMPSPSFHDGYRCTQIIDAIRTSSATGRSVEIEQG